ncbi:MAG TPA: alpha/beta hydrolase [Polyangia bacterium]|jgi:pimeloyl-ACP methyl ester carboxylesterase
MTLATRLARRHHAARDDTIVLEGKWLKAGDRRVHAQVSRPAGRRQCVLLVPGDILTPALDQPLAVRLARDFHVLAPDLPSRYHPGHGPLAPATVADSARTLAAIIDDAGIEPPVVVGTGFGCHVVAALAATRPDAVRAAVLQAPMPDPALRRAPALLRRSLRCMRHEPLTPYLVAVLELGVHGLRRAAETLARLCDRGLEETLRAVPVPTLVVRGACDRLVSRGWAMDLASRLPRGWLQEIPGAPHAMGYAAPDALAAAVHEFAHQL